MAMVNVVHMLPTGRILAQAEWLGPKVGDHWLFLQSPCEPGEVLQCSKYNDSNINIVQVLLLLTLDSNMTR